MNKTKNRLSKFQRQIVRIIHSHHLWSFPLLLTFSLPIIFIGPSSRGPLIHVGDLPTGSLSANSFSGSNPGEKELFIPAWRTTSDGVEISFNTVDKFPVLDLSPIIFDRENRVEDLFQITRPLEPRVRFWLNIYTQYSSRIRVVHDRENLNVVYGVIDFSPLFHSMRLSETLEQKIKNTENETIDMIKNKILTVAGLSKKVWPVSPIETNQIQRFLSKLGVSGRKSTLALLERIRTQSGQKDEFILALHRSTHLLPHIESEFRKLDLPPSLSRLPFVESSFNAKAQSKAGAVGIWQFIPETAKEMIHENNETLWSDPIIQTKGAARLLKMYKKLLHDWGSVITSYNSGIGRLMSLHKKYRVHRLEELLNHPEFEGLGFAGKNFYSQFLAVVFIEAYKEELFKPWHLPNKYSLPFNEFFPFEIDVCKPGKEI